MAVKWCSAPMTISSPRPCGLRLKKPWTSIAGRRGLRAKARMEQSRIVAFQSTERIVTKACLPQCTMVQPGEGRRHLTRLAKSLLPGTERPGGKTIANGADLNKMPRRVCSPEGTAVSVRKSNRAIKSPEFPTLLHQCGLLEAQAYACRAGVSSRRLRDTGLTHVAGGLLEASP